MKADILGRAEVILATVDEIDERSPQTVKEYEERLLDRINRTLQDYNINIDEQRVLTEVAVFADKVAVAEETVRLRSHFCTAFKDNGITDSDRQRNRLYYSGNEPRGEHNRFKGSGRRNCP